MEVDGCSNIHIVGVERQGGEGSGTIDVRLSRWLEHSLLRDLSPDATTCLILNNDFSHVLEADIKLGLCAAANNGMARSPLLDWSLTTPILTITVSMCPSINMSTIRPLLVSSASRLPLSCNPGRLSLIYPPTSPQTTSARTK